MAVYANLLDLKYYFSVMFGFQLIAFLKHLDAYSYLDLFHFSKLLPLKKYKWENYDFIFVSSSGISNFTSYGNLSPFISLFNIFW